MTYISQAPKRDEYGTCAVCPEPGVQDDHVLFPQKKSKRVTAEMKRWQNKEFNIQPACAKHNIDHTTNTHKQRKAHIAMWLEQDPDNFLEWFYDYPGSRVLGSLWHETQMIVLEVINENENNQSN